MKRLILMINDSIEENAVTPMHNAFPLAQEALAKGAPRTLRIPYAEVPYDRDGIVGLQRFTKAEADVMVQIFNKQKEDGGHGVCGYIGHPDYVSSPEDAKRFMFDEPEAVVWVVNMRAVADALELDVDWTPQGEKLVTSRTFRFFSPFWMSEAGKVEKGQRIYLPRILKSLGLTNKPNWRMPPIINSVTHKNGGINKGESQMKEWLKKLQTLLNSENEITEDGALDIFKAMCNSLGTIRTAVAALVPEGKEFAESPEGTAAMFVEVFNSQVASAKAAADLQTANSNLQESMKAIKTTYATALVNQAVAAGTVLQAHANSKIEELVNAQDFNASVAILNSLPPLMKIKDAYSKQSSKDVETLQARRSKIAEMVNSAQAAGLDYDKAFAKVRREHPELFAEDKSTNAD